MNTLRTSVISILLILMLPAFAAENSSFKVTIKGDKINMESFQLRAELKMARSTDFCRGQTMPRRLSDWSCKQIGGGESRCETSYQCSFINKKFSRVTESQRLRKAINSRRISRKSFSIVVAKKPYKNLDRYRMAKEIQREKALAAKERERRERAVLRQQVRTRAKRLKNEMTEFDEFQELEKKLDTRAQEQKIDPAIAEASKREAEELAAIEAQAAQEDSDVFGDSTLDSNDDFESEELSAFDDEESGEVQSEEKAEESASTSTPSKTKWLSFSASLLSIGDTEGNSVTTFGIEWNPLWELGKNWHARGRLGYHPYSAIIEEGEEAESFSTYEVGLNLEWNLLSNAFYVIGGYGMQSWGSSTGGTFSVLSMGAGYTFEERKDRMIDQVFLMMNSVSNEYQNTEIKFGANFIF